LLLESGDYVAAEAAYGRAVQILDGMRTDMSSRSRDTFERLVEPVYSGEADLMLQQARALPESAEKQRHLDQVRSLLERLKQAEVANYFGADCVAVRHENSSAKSDDAAILYPVLLAGRIELLVDVRGSLSQFTVPIGRNQITHVVRSLRLKLEHPQSGDSYLPESQQLYQWLVKPFEETLRSAATHTLVVVPSGALRTLPLGALHDGQHFLVERFALAVTPSIELVRTAGAGPIEHIVAGGLTEGRQGYSPLPGVTEELATATSHYPALVLRDEAFQRATLTMELSNPVYQVAHFATHGQFAKDYRNSFILTYDSKLSLQDLQEALGRRTGQPLELLVLSACQTAAGDDRAALGLAGIAVQSGARTAIASLWSINDRATSQLMTTFYHRLRVSHESKAQSLRAAQVALLTTPRYSHPSYWAPFLLIGNWQ
jgi:CHAT domain-containing protein